MASKKVCDVLVAGDHGTTYGGNPLACAAISTVFDLFEKNNITDNVKEVGQYLYDRLEEIRVNHPEIIDHRGIGFIQGLEFTNPVGPVVAKLLEEGVITFTAGTNVIRFIPPLIATKAHVDEMIEKLDKCL